MSAELFLTVDTDATITAIYSDDLSDLMSEGKATTRRASHVEPDAQGGWSADMSPSGGPVLGSFTLRSEALAAEVEWLKESLSK